MSAASAIALAPRPRRSAVGRRRALPPGLLGATLKALPEGVFIAEARWTRQGLPIVFVNERFCAMTGYASVELVGKNHTFFHLDQTELVRQRRWFRRLSADKTYASEGYVACRDGSTLVAAWLLNPVCDAQGRITHVVASYRDVTEKRRLQEALVQAQRIDAVGRLAGGVAHDFNNLLSVINGYSEILADRVSHDERARHDLAEIHGAGQKAAALTRQLLAFSRRQATDPRVLNLNDVIREHAELLGRLLRPDKHLRLNLDPQLANVRIDPAALQQVLLNLTLNARDALSPGGQVTLATSSLTVKPTVTGRRLSELPPGRYVQLSVSDSGSGMDEHVQAHLFEPFFTTKPQGQGTGLGLALVYSVVQQSGGFITVRSTPKVGTTFDLTLPEVDEPAQARPNLLTALPATGGRESVLIVEEDDVLRKMIAGILTSDGYRVHPARNAGEGLGVARAARPPVDLIIADCSLPGGPGEKLARQLVLTRPSTRVVSTTSTDDSSGGLHWLSNEAQAHLAKPFTLSTLLRVIRGLLDAPAAPARAAS